MLHIILIGPQGCGKGTQAQYILKEFNLTYIEAGAMIRQKALLHTQKAEILNHLVNKKGILLPDGIVLDMVYDELDTHSKTQGYLFDGFPRSLIQYQELNKYLKKKNQTIDLGLYLHISDDEAVKRLTSRLLCSVCKKGFSRLLEPERTTCVCGGRLEKRIDDRREVIQQRLMEFHKTTSPILEALKTDGILRKINGEQPIENIAQECKHTILEVLNRKQQENI